MKRTKWAKKSTFFAILSILLSCLLFAGIANAAAKKPFRDESGKEIKVKQTFEKFTSKGILTGDQTNTWGRNEFTVQDKYQDQIYGLVTGFKGAKERFEKCKSATGCGTARDELYLYQTAFLEYGIKVHVPLNNDGRFNETKDFVVVYKDKVLEGLYNAAVKSATKYRNQELLKCGKTDNGKAPKGCPKNAAKDKIDKLNKANKEEEKKQKESLEKLKSKDKAEKEKELKALCEKGQNKGTAACKEKDVDKAIDLMIQQSQDRMDQADKNIEQAQQEEDEEDDKAQKDETDQYNDSILVGKGLFTKSEVPGPVKCEKAKELYEGWRGKFERGVLQKDQNSAPVDPQSLSAGLDGDGGKGGSFIAEIVFKGILKPAAGLFDVSCGVSFINAFLKITTPVNITNNAVVMKVVGVTQMIALGASVIMIAAYGITYTLIGLEGMNPYKFAIRLLFAMLAVYTLPYLMQDILNINNVVVAYLSNIDQTATVDGNGIGNAVSAYGVGVTFVLAAVIGAIVAAVVATGGLASLPILIIGIVALILLAKPIIQIILWWYFRMLTLFILAVLGPFFVIMMAIPGTARNARNWMNMFIAQTFSQTFLAIGVYLFTSIFLNLWTFNAAVGNMGFIGNLFMVYAMVVTLTELPGLAGKLLGSSSDPIGAKAMNEMSNVLTQTLGTAAAVTGREVEKKRAANELHTAAEKDLKSSFDAFSNQSKQGSNDSFSNFVNDAIEGKIQGDKTTSSNEKSGDNTSTSGDVPLETTGSFQEVASNINEDTIVQAQKDLMNGKLDRNEFADRIANDLMSNNKDMNEVEAKAKARGFVQQYDKNADISLDTRNEIQKDIAKGKASQESVEKMIRKDLLARNKQGDGNSGEIAYQTAQIMEDYGYKNLDKDKDRRTEVGQKYQSRFDAIKEIRVGKSSARAGKPDMYTSQENARVEIDNLELQERDHEFEQRDRQEREQDRRKRDRN